VRFNPPSATAVTLPLSCRSLMTSLAMPMARSVVSAMALFQMARVCLASSKRFLATVRLGVP